MIYFIASNPYIRDLKVKFLKILHLEKDSHRNMYAWQFVIILFELTVILRSNKTSMFNQI